jgi:hypothetical protein
MNGDSGVIVMAPGMVSWLEFIRYRIKIGIMSILFSPFRNLLYHTHSIYCINILLFFRQAPLLLSSIEE